MALQRRGRRLSSLPCLECSHSDERCRSGGTERDRPRRLLFLQTAALQSRTSTAAPSLFFSVSSSLFPCSARLAGCCCVWAAQARREKKAGRCGAATGSERRPCCCCCWRRGRLVSFSVASPCSISLIVELVRSICWWCGGVVSHDTSAVQRRLAQGDANVTAASASSLTTSAVSRCHSLIVHLSTQRTARTLCLRALPQSVSLHAATRGSARQSANESSGLASLSEAASNALTDTAHCHHFSQLSDGTAGSAASAAALAASLLDELDPFRRSVSFGSGGSFHCGGQTDPASIDPLPGSLPTSDHRECEKRKYPMQAREFRCGHTSVISCLWLHGNKSTQSKQSTENDHLSQMEGQSASQHRGLGQCRRSWMLEYE